MYDNPILWVLRYSSKEPKENLWTKYPMDYQKSFIEKILNLFNTGGHKPVSKDVFSPYDNRIISVPVFSFVNQVMSLLSNPTIMSEEYLIKDYDVLTGKCGTNFWDPNTIDPNDTLSTPVPLDPNINIANINSSYLFQGAVSRFCTQAHHTPVPIIIYYGKANLTQNGDLTLAPLIFTLGFFKSSWRHKTVVWRIFG